MAKKSIPQKQSASKKSDKKGSASNHIALGLVLLLCALITLGGIAGAAGEGGRIFALGAYWLLGMGEIIIPIALGTAAVLLMRKRPFEASWREGISAAIGLLALLGLLSLASSFGLPAGAGGIIGTLVALPFLNAFEMTFSTLILVVITFGSFVIFFDHTPNPFPFFERIWARLTGRKSAETILIGEDDVEEQDPKAIIAAAKASLKEAQAQAVSGAPEREKDLVVHDASANKNEFAMPALKRMQSSGIEYTPPPLNLLEGDRGKANVGDVKANANIIRRTLLNFGIEVEMDEITIGPTVTRYALKPAQGVKVSRIVGLQSDLALALAAQSLRIEAPIPGKSLVGIEIPNKTKATVGLGTLLADPAFTESGKPLLAALGRNIAGKAVFQSIAKMPHLLIAGTTGSGKSVTIHAIITSLIYGHGPDELRFIFVDPKRVELTLYNGIPHLLTPVITDAKKAILSLKWAATEMNRRYDLLESESVRDIDSYHKKHASDFAKKVENVDRMPYIIIVIDELADIMQSYPRELEAAIVRLAQMSRAVGIHLILSTQRPEVNVITGLIKANVPSRIALRVPTGIDSRTILDTTGAEKLLGQGDMLAFMGEGAPQRVQSAYIPEDEVKGVVAHLKEAFKDDIRDGIELTGNISGSSDRPMFSDEMEGGEDDDALYEDARMAVMEAGKASTSYIQRKLKVGYARAARLVDMLEERGVVGPADGAKAREILDRGPKHSTVDTVADEMGI